MQQLIRDISTSAAGRPRIPSTIWDQTIYPFIKVCTEMLRHTDPELRQKITPGQFLCTRKITTNYCNNKACKGNHNVGPRHMFQLFSDINKHGSPALKQAQTVTLTALNPCAACAVTDAGGAQIGGTPIFQRTKNGGRFMLHRTPCFHCGKSAYLLSRQLANERLSATERKNPNTKVHDIERLGNKFDAIARNGLEDERFSPHHKPHPR